MLIKEMGLGTEEDDEGFARALASGEIAPVRLTSKGYDVESGEGKHHYTSDDFINFYLIWLDGRQTKKARHIQRGWKDIFWDRNYDESGNLKEEGPSYNRTFRVLFGALGFLGALIGLPVILALVLNGEKELPLSFIATIYGTVMAAATVNEGWRRFTNGTRNMTASK